MKKFSIITLLAFSVIFTSCQEAPEKTTKEDGTKKVEVSQAVETPTENTDTAALITEVKPIDIDRSNVIIVKEGTVKEKDSVVTLDYIGTLEDGSVFDTSKLEGVMPLSFTTGEGKMLEEFEKNLIGMKTGESKTFVIPAGKGYEINQGEIYEIPATALKSFKDLGIELKEGAKLPTLRGEVVLKEIKDDGKNVVIDANPAIAGKALKFEVTILSVQDKAEMEASIKALHEEMSEEADKKTQDENIEVEGKVIPKNNNQ